MDVKAIDAGFGALVFGVALTGESLAQSARLLEGLLDEHSLVVLRDTDIDEAEFLALGRSFGELANFSPVGEPRYIQTLSNLADDGGLLPADHPKRRSNAANAFWHTDHTYMAKRARYSFLRPQIIPDEGGDTQFADTRTAFDALPIDMKQQLDGLVALHSIVYSRSLAGYTQWTDEQRRRLHPVPQPVVFRNSRTGRRSLYLASHIAEIIGVPTSEARALVTGLIAHSTQPRFRYTHEWRPGDIAIWDNRATMHRSVPFNDLAEARQMLSLRVLELSDLYDPAEVYEIT